MQHLNAGQLYMTIIGTAIVSFLAGRAYQAIIFRWQKWRSSVAEIPGLRKSAFTAIGGGVRMGSIGLLVICAIAAAAYTRGSS